ncbi:sigma-70 RNA polymerase sigma factor region 4 domain-containing protein [Thermospira aquatica]|uniref:Sigma-70 family RNA polymerase sigma factor n=1 Tax=Thermospira aquatica TaxID=2828656 RepID=A0AAX3BEW4_9SPIR|nr:hypothetical protein [Thermospira aquatica]URA10675.1 sigma-70 family RNA polymerase sigma factor [Thermospira aquatica]
MQLDDEKILCLFQRYQQGELSVLSLLRKEVEIFIYEFPRMAYHAGGDECGDFYLYMIERLESVWKQWDPEKTPQFSLWFSTILRYRYLDFLRWRDRPPPTDVLYEEECVAPVDDENNQWERLRVALVKLQDHDRLWIKWFYLPEELSPEEIKLTKSLTGHSYQTLLSLQQEMIVEKLKDIEKIRKTSEELGSLCEDIASLKALMQNPEEKNPQNIQKLMKLEVRRNRLMKTLSQNNTTLLRVFSKLFTSPREAKNRLKLAESRLKYLLHTPEREKGVSYVLS